MFRNALLASGLVCVLALAVACGKNNPTPVSPSGAEQVDSEAAADGTTLKATAPTPQFPVNGQQVELGEIILRVANSQAKFGTASLMYRFQVFNSAGKLMVNRLVASGKEGTTSLQVTDALEFNAAHTWKCRAEYLGAYGPWSSTATFKTPEGGYIHDSEILDPLTNGKTVGTVYGSVSFIPGKGAKMNTNQSRISYRLPVTLQAGEYSFMATDFDEGSQGTKSKMMTMGEGGGDITANDYRASVEVRGAQHAGIPGTLAFRFITGESADKGRIHDIQRTVLDWSDTNWYFFRIRWVTGAVELEIRRDSESGPIHYYNRMVTDGHPYRPNPHFIHIGSPKSRSGWLASTLAGITVKNLWVSARPRPKF